MKILETMVLARDQQYLDELTSSLSVEKETISEVDIYRYVIDEDLVILIHVFRVDKKISEELLHHLIPHLSGLLIVTNSQISRIPESESAFIDKMAQKLEDKPKVMAVRMEARNINYLNHYVRDSGLFLSENGRVLFWNPNLIETHKRVWEAVWGLT